MAESRRRTSSRRDLAALHATTFGDVSPEAGALDEQAFADLLGADADDALALLADLTTATDRRLAALARSLAGRVVLDLTARAGSGRGGRAARLRVAPMPETGGDLDIDASLDALLGLRSRRHPVAIDLLRAQVWDHPQRAVCLLVDRSGSMRGSALATAALAAAAVAIAAPDDHSIVAFSDEAVVVKAQDRSTTPTERVVDDLLALRGRGTTDLSLACRVAHAQLDRSNSRQRLVVLLSDGRATTGGDAVRAACELTATARLAIVAPRADAVDATALAVATGARLALFDGPASIPATFAALLG